MIGSRRQISLARNVEKHHRFWGARALGSWQSIQIACRLQESVREDTGRRILHVVRIELTARSHILVSWSVYPNYEYHYFSMYLVHLWLAEKKHVAWSANLTKYCECTGAVARTKQVTSRLQYCFNGIWMSRHVSAILTKFFNWYLAGPWSVSRSQRCVVSEFLYVVQWSFKCC